jgi:non-heme chloroperoxidase
MTEVTAHKGLLSKTRVHVEDTGGGGRPVVLIHGWPLSGESWQYQVPALAHPDGPLTPSRPRRC